MNTTAQLEAGTMSHPHSVGGMLPIHIHTPPPPQEHAPIGRGMNFAKSLLNERQHQFPPPRVAGERLKVAERSTPTFDRGGRCRVDRLREDCGICHLDTRARGGLRKFPTLFNVVKC